LLASPFGRGSISELPYEAPDAEQAVKAAISQFGISNPHEQARLAAQRVGEIG
jgi:predicted chitinase